MKKISKKCLWLFSVIVLLFGCTLVTEAAVPKVKTLKWSNVKTGFYMDVNSYMKLKTAVKPSGAKKRALKWTSSNTKIATVGKKGKVHAKSTGTVTITCKVKSQPSKRIKCKIHVIVPSEKIEIDSKSITMRVGEQYELGASISPKNATLRQIKYQCSKTGVVSVDKNGVMKARKTGSVMITLSPADGRAKKVTCDVEVFEKAEKGNVKYIGHRGLRSRAPENTVKSFQLAGEAGFWGAECDIQETKDGEFAVMHDATLLRMCGVNSSVSDLTLAELRAIPIIHGSNFALYENDPTATTIPTLREYLAVCISYHMVPVIEVKKQVPPSSMSKLYAQVKSVMGNSETVYVSQSMDDLIALRELIGTNEQISLQHIIEKPEITYIPEYQQYRIALSAKYTMLSDAAMKEFLNAGIPIDLWTVNLISLVSKFEKKGASYITTDCVFW